MRRPSIGRQSTTAALAWALALAPPLASAAAADAGADTLAGPPAARRLVVTSRDPALVAALAAAFSPRGVKVVESHAELDPPDPEPGEAAGAQAAAVTDVVWLCEPDGGGTALCVRPHGGKIIVRRISMSTPLSPAEAASLALSVQVALMPDEPARALDVAPAGPAASAPAAVVAARPAAASAPGLRGLTVETVAGVRASGLGSGLRAGVDAAYAPAALGHLLGIGAGVSDGAALALPRPPLRGPGPPPPDGSERDLTVRLFARGRLRLPALWLQLDAGPAAHVVSSDMSAGGGSTVHDRRLELSADAAVGAVVPFGRFFAGLRGGASYRIATDRMQPAPAVNPWAAEGLFALGVGFM
jgi:hypothetical protein